MFTHCTVRWTFVGPYQILKNIGSKERIDRRFLKNFEGGSYLDMVEVGGSNPPGPTKIDLSH